MLGDKIVRGPGVVDCPPQQPVLPSLGRRADRVGQERGRWVNKPLPGPCFPVIRGREGTDRERDSIDLFVMDVTAGGHARVYALVTSGPARSVP